MGRSQVAYNQKRSGRGRGRGRGGNNDRQAATRSSKAVATTIPQQRAQQPFLPSLDKAASVAEQAEHFLSLGSATANDIAMQKGHDTNKDLVFHSDHTSLDPQALASALYGNHSRRDLLRLPTHILSHVYGKSAAVEPVAEAPTTTTERMLIDVTGMQEDEEDHTTVQAGNNVRQQQHAAGVTMVEAADGDDDDMEDENCVVYLGTKQPSDPNNEDDLDDWLDSVIS